MVILPLPPVAEMERLLGELLGTAVRATPADAAPTGRVALAHYASDAPVLEAVVMCDAPLAAALGAALSVMPPEAVRRAAEAEALDDALGENVREVMQVVTRHLAARSGLRFVMRACTWPPLEPAARLLAAALGSDEVRAFLVDVAGYGAGRLAFCTL